MINGKLQRLYFTDHYNLIVKIITIYSYYTGFILHQQGKAPQQNYKGLNGRLTDDRTARRRLELDKLESIREN